MASDLEHAITIEQWEELQWSIDADNELVAFTDEQLEVLREQLEEIDKTATHATLTELVRRHRSEFVLILNNERSKALATYENNQLELFVHTLLDDPTET